MNTELLTRIILKSKELTNVVQSIIHNNTDNYKVLEDDEQTIKQPIKQSIEQINFEINSTSNPMNDEMRDEVRDEVNDKRGKHNNHYYNKNYEGMSPKQKQKAITRNYYQNKGKLNFIKRKFTNKFHLEKDFFIDCKTETEVNEHLYHFFKKQGMDDAMFYSITKVAIPI